MWLKNRSIEAFMGEYKLKTVQSQQALERVEARSKVEETGGPRLSTRMRKSWQTELSWFYHKIQKSFDVDAVY